MPQKMKFGRYDYAAYWAFTAYAASSLSIPLTLVAMGKSLNFPLDAGGMGTGGTLHLVRSAAMLITLMLCGAVANRIGKRITMGLAMTLMGAGIFLCGFAPVYAALLPFLLLAGCGEGLCEGICTPFIQDLHSDAPERYVNFSHGFWSVGICFCVLLTGSLLSLGVSWRVVLMLVGVAALTNGIFFLWKEKPGCKFPEQPRSQKGNRGIWQKSVQIAKVPRFWVYCLGMFMGSGAEFCLTFWAASYLELAFRATPLLAGLGTASIALGMFTGRMLTGYFAKPKLLKYFLLGCSLLTIPMTLMLALLSPESFSSVWMQYAALYIMLAIAGVGIAPFWPSLQVYGVTMLPELDSTMLYIYFSAVGIPGAGFFTWFLGVLGDKWGLNGAFFMLPVTLVLYAIIVYLEGWVWPRKNARQQ